MCSLFASEPSVGVQTKMGAKRHGDTALACACFRISNLFAPHLEWTESS